MQTTNPNLQGIKIAGYDRVVAGLSNTSCCGFFKGASNCQTEPAPGIEILGLHFVKIHIWAV